MQDISSISHSIYSESEKNQLKLVDQLLETGDAGLNILLDWMVTVKSQSNNLALGKAYHALYSDKKPKIKDFLKNNYPHGVVPLESELDLDYQPLQQLLAQQDFQGADVVTLQKMCEWAGAAAVERNWIYFTEVVNFPIVDFQTLDQLWRMSSELDSLP